MKGFMDFIKEQGVVGLAIGFILGGSVAKVVSSLVDDIIQPILGLILGSAEGLTAAHIMIGGAQINYGNFLAVIIDFVVIALIVYYTFKCLKLDKKK